MPAEASIEERKGEAIGTPDQYWVTIDSPDSIFAFKVTSRGYADNIKYLVSVNTAGMIIGMTVLEQAETPGLGSRVQEVISNKYIWNGLFSKKEAGLSWFTEQYRGINILRPIGINKSVGEWHKLNDSDRQKLISENSITAITGSTISTRAVTQGLESKARDYLNALRGPTHD
jgi:electron transport complex protein RnfG